MNERIRELAEQAELNATLLFNKDKLEKFAELIVRESLVDFYRNHLDTTCDEDITVQVDRYVKQRFGVEK